MSDVIIYHNPKCGTSRNTLARIRERGIEPQIVEYLKATPSRAELVSLLDRAGLKPREVIRAKEGSYAELGLSDPGLSDDALIDAMIANPILIERPLVVTALGVRLCRPADKVLEILPA